MALSEAQRQRVIEFARRKGEDPEELLKVAEQESEGQESAAPEGEGETEGQPAQPVLETLLVGLVPYLKVRELREKWLGVTDSVVDDHLTVAEWNIKHGEQSLQRRGLELREQQGAAAPIPEGEE